SWLKIHRGRLINFRGITVTNNKRCAEDWIKKVVRDKVGFSANQKRLAWNHNTGAMAVNLAVLLGAKKIYLLGFDMKLESKRGDANWFRNEKDKPNAQSYPRFLSGFEHVKAGVKQAGVEVVNTNPNSAMECFPKVKLNDVLA
ncbi:unnamed protein product, partial [marine sediment metagenome]